MQTNFSLAQLADADTAEAEKILRTCVHCGFCTATCPTYVLLGDELDSPRGRIYLIKDMLEGDKPASATVARHIDRCLSCLACMTTCPSGVNYMHLVDHARRRIQETFRRPWRDQALRRLLATVLPRPWLFRLSLQMAGVARPFVRFLPSRVAGMLALAPRRVPLASPMDRQGFRRQIFRAKGERRKRVALLVGCAQPVLKPGINEATIRLLTRHGIEVVVARGSGCCGSLTHHMGEAAAALTSARNNIAAWLREIEGEGLDAIIANASGCGTTLKDYGFMLREDPAWAEKAAKVSALARDVTEVVAELGLAPVQMETYRRVAYHSACSMQHGQRLDALPRQLLAKAGFDVREVPEGHLCCGSAGTYNILQPVLAGRLRNRKLANIARTGAEVVATGNIGCIQQLEAGLDVPILHTVELLDWATGGP
ncbi:MAG: glycolate oxidase iron-sulfur subunit, partial [Rhodospirillaceae bacterium]|nr:glycolate oxidase iron-sulfur subunit [Rhodospirillaceae bacterium]